MTRDEFTYIASQIGQVRSQQKPIINLTDKEMAAFVGYALGYTDDEKALKELNKGLVQTAIKNLAVLYRTTIRSYSATDIKNFVADTYRNFEKLEDAENNLVEKYKILDNYKDTEMDAEMQGVIKQAMSSAIDKVIEKGIRDDIAKDPNLINYAKLAPDVLYQEQQDALKQQVAPVPMNQEQINRLLYAMSNTGKGKVKVKNPKIKQIFFSSYAGDYTDFSTLPMPLMVAIGSEVLIESRIDMEHIDFSDPENPATKNFINQSKNLSKNPAFRLGLSLGCNYPGELGMKYRKAETYLNQQIMADTLTLPSHDQIYEKKRSLMKEEDSLLLETKESQAFERQVAANEEAVMNMATMLYLTHLGDVTVSDTQTQDPKVYQESIAEMMAHGGRLKINLPSELEELPGHNSKETIDAIVPPESIHRRIFATHSIKHRAKVIQENGHMTVQKDSKEGKPFLTHVLHNHYYNVAIGGMMNTLSDGHVIENNGENGHVYIKYRKGDKQHGALVLCGIEPAEGGKSTHLGYAHDASAKNAAQNAFLTDKRMVGLKQNARSLNLATMKPEELRQKIRIFRENYSRILHDPENAEQLARMNAMLVGKKMSQEELQRFDATLMDEEQHQLLLSTPQSTLLKGAEQGTHQVIDSEWVIMQTRLYDAKVKGKKHWFGHDDSPEMKGVKTAIDQIIVAGQSGQEITEEMLNRVTEACREYMNPRHKKDKSNKRWKAVVALSNFVAAYKARHFEDADMNPAMRQQSFNPLQQMAMQDQQMNLNQSMNMNQNMNLLNN